jgi:thymidylate synthase
MNQYLETLKLIMDTGVDRDDRTGTGTRSIFAHQMRFDLQQGFPAVTTKKLAFKSVVSELLWFLEGSSDERRLAEIRYGKPRAELEGKTTIWTANAEADYWKHGTDLGRVYGKQWREWRTSESWSDEESAEWWKNNDITKVREFKPYHTVDQIANVIQNIKDKPWDRRHLIIAYNPGELDQMCLPPCHFSFQFYVADGKLSCHMTQRSCDMFLGVPFNIASYALLTHLVAQVTDLDVGELVITLNDAHIYNNHFDQVQEQLSRTPDVLPTLNIKSTTKDINNFTMDDFVLEDYNPQAAIKADMAV